MTPRQQEVFDDLLMIGAARPYAPPHLVEELRATLTAALTPVVARWSEPSLWLTKSAVMSVRRCEAGFLAARADRGPAVQSPAAAGGDIAHRAIQMAYTHPGHPIAKYIDAAVRAGLTTDAAFEQLWSSLDMGAQSDILMSATSRVTNLLDSWPQILPAGEPRFEEAMQSKVAGVTVAARVDLLLGRPRPSGQQSMVIIDWKSGATHEHHEAESRYHALAATLSYGVPPFRSLVYSLSSGDHTQPDVTADTLRQAVTELVEAATATVDLLTERREPRVECGQRWCPACSGATAPRSPALV